MPATRNLVAFPSQHRLATQLVALVVLSTLLSGTGTGVLVIAHARQTLRDEILRSGLATADLAASVAAGYMNDAQADARDLAESSSLRMAATRGDFASSTAELEQWLSTHPDLQGIGLTDLTGVLRATGLADKSSVGSSSSFNRDWFQRVLATEQPFMGAPGLSPVTNLAQVPYGVPVRDDAGALRAVMIASVSLARLSDTLTSVRLGPNARTNLNDREHGLILANVDRSRMLTPSSGQNEATRRMEAGERGAIENVNSSGQQTLAAFAPVPGLPWGVLIQQPSQDAFAPVDEMVRQVIVLVSAVLVVAGGLGVALALGITEPLHQLRVVVEAMAGGELRLRVRSTRNDELGEFGRGFDRMADQLQQTLTDLQDGEARFRGLISAAFDGFAMHQDGLIIEASAPFARLFGYQQSELVGRSVLDLAAPESRELIMRNIANGVEEPYETVGLRRGEERFHVEFVDKASSFEGRPARAIAVRDITPRKKAQEDGNRMAAIAASSSEAIVGTAVDGTVTDWNGGAERLYGYSAHDMVGSRISRLIPPERGSEMGQMMERLNRGERIHNLETVRMARDGSMVNVSVSISPVLDDQGHTIGAATVAHDITERKAAEAALQESEARYRRLVELSPQAILVQDSESILYANLAAARLAGAADPSELLGSPVLELVHPDDRDAVRLRLHSIAAESHLNDLLEARLVRRDGQVLETEISIIPTTYRGRPAFQTIVDDVSARKAAEKQAKSLAQAEKLRALGQMASGIAHDLNQSLMLVASYSELATRALDREPPDREELSNLFSTATQAALDGGEAVKRLLLFTRQAAEQEGQPVDLGALVRDVAQMTAPRWRDTSQVEGRPISLHIESIGHPMILGSAARLREALTNLIFNSVDALSGGGTIRLTVGAEAQRAIVRVTDTGVGMSSEVQARIFEPFYTTKGGSGTGLGLSMVFGIVEQHGGSINVQSTPGGGTTIQLAFPLIDAALAQAQKPEPLARPREVGPLRVLAVDDEPAMTKAVVRMLRPAGHLVSIASSAEEALERMATESFDVLISDMGMGAGMNGWELAAAVKKRWPEVRFLLATGWGAAIDPAEARAKGVESVLAKPYRLIDLEHALAGSQGSDLAA
jgi:PAS domain S-box-containing protein